MEFRINASKEEKELGWLRLSQLFNVCSHTVKMSKCTPLGRILRLDLITVVGLKCPSVRPQKVSLISMKFGMYM